MKTAGAPARVVLAPDRARIRADGEDLSFVTVRVEDSGRQPRARAPTTSCSSRCEGAGRIAAVDNGNAASLEPFQADQRRAFSGLALLIVRSKRGEAGPIRVTATSDGLTAAGALLRAE